MPKFKCENKECIKHTELDHELKVRFVWNTDTQRLESEYDKCPVCSSHRNVVKDENTGMPWFKSEDSRNYNNKKVKKTDDYEYRPSDDAKATPLKDGVKF